MKRSWMLPVLLMYVCFLSVPVRAAGAENETANLLLSAAGERTERLDAMPGETLRCVSVFTAEGGKPCVAAGVLSDGLEFGTLLTLRSGGQTVNAAYYTLVTKNLPRGEAFRVVLSGLFAPAGPVRLEIEYTLRLNDRADPRAGESAFSVMLAGEDGAVLRGEPGRVCFSGFSVYRGIAIPEERKSNPVYGACFSLYRDPELTERMAFREVEEDVFLACTAAGCSHTRHEYLLRTRASGTVFVSGLPEGVYYLREIPRTRSAAPAAEGMEIVVTAEGEVFAGGMELRDGRLQLIDRLASETSGEEDDPVLTFYENGCKVMACLLGIMVLGKKRLLG